jgi:hypothetical protein
MKEAATFFEVRLGHNGDNVEVRSDNRREVNNKEGTGK